jgi:hypothetical protein
MNSNDMLDYCLGQLEGPAREQAERELAADPPAAQFAGRLTRALSTLLDDGRTIEAPAGLARQTLLFVTDSTRPRRRTILDFVPVTVPFRWADVAVAAGIFFASVLTLLPAVGRSRERMDQAGCGYNLQQLGRALWQYGSLHHHYPFAPEANSHAPTASFVSLLRDGGLLSDAELAELDCPFNGPARRRTSFPDFDTACSDTEAARRAIEIDYAYNVGHRLPSGRVAPINAVHSATVPMLSDQPPHHDYRIILAGNSPNHRGRGQNVLYTDLHVGWHNSRRLNAKDADMFLNKRSQPAPGVDPDDSVLLPSLTPFLGW